MLKLVLESISDMLEEGLKDTPDKPAGDLGVLLAHIKCAKALLDKTIQGMRRDELDVPSVQDIPRLEPRKTAPKEGEIQYALEVENGILKKVSYPSGEELGAEVMLELDGFAFSYKEAKGRSFQNGRVL